MSNVHLHLQSLAPGHSQNFWKLLAAWCRRKQNFPLPFTASSSVIDSCSELRTIDTYIVQKGTFYLSKNTSKRTVISNLRNRSVVTGQNTIYSGPDPPPLLSHGGISRLTSALFVYISRHWNARRCRVSQNYPNMFFAIFSTTLKPLMLRLPKFSEVLIKSES